MDRYRVAALAVLCYESATEEALGPPTADRRPHYAEHVAGCLHSMWPAQAPGEIELVTSALLALAPLFDAEL